MCNGTTKFELVQSVFVFKSVVTVRLSVTRLIVPAKYLARKFTVIPESGTKNDVLIPKVEANGPAIEAEFVAFT